MEPPTLNDDELFLLDLAQWEDAAENSFDDIGLTNAELEDITETFGEILDDEDYADIFSAEGITDPPSPRIRIDHDKLRRLRDKIRAMRGRLWERMKELHKEAVTRVIDSLLQGHPLPPSGGGMLNP